MWIHFSNDSQAEFKINLKFHEQIIANTVLLKIISHTPDDVDLCGPNYDQTF